MESEGTTAGSGTTYYVSVSREHNGRVKLSCSAHYTAQEGEDEGTSAVILAKAVATSLTVGAAAQASIERVLEMDETMVAGFIEMVNEVGADIAQRMWGGK